MKYFFGLVAFNFILTLYTAAYALDSKPVLNLALAKKMADACEAAQEATGYRKINIAIVNEKTNISL